MMFKMQFPLLQVLHLQEEKTLLKESSEQEAGQLWVQLESMRANRQELGGETDENLKST